MTDQAPIEGGVFRLLETAGPNVGGFMEGFRGMLSLMSRLAARQLDGQAVAVVFNADGEGEPGQTILYGPPAQLRRLIAELTALADRGDAECAARRLGAAPREGQGDKP